MIKLTAQANIDDMMLDGRSIPRQDIERIIANQLTRSFADELEKAKDFQDSIVRRERQDCFPMIGRTIYESRMYLITPAEAVEFEELRKFKADMKRFVL
jgi:hypothetical protein